VGEKMATTMTRRYCIAGAWYSSPNIGDQTILATVLQQVRALQPDAHFTVLSSRPEFVTDRHDVEALHVLRSPLSVLAALAKADVYIVGGGTPFYASLSNLMKFLLTVAATRLFRRKVVIYAVSSRELYTWWSRVLTGRVLRLADRITIRENETLTYFRRLYPALSLELTSDPAILANELASPGASSLLLREGVPLGEETLFGFACRDFDTQRQFRVHHYEGYTESQLETCWLALAKAADLLTKRGVVVFFPMNTVSPDDDVSAAEKIRSRMRSPNRTIVVQRQFTPPEAVAAFAEFKLVVASRLHGTVLAASQYVPSVGLSYGHKMAGFLSELIPPPCNLRIDGLSVDDVAKGVQYLLDHYEEVVVSFRDRVDICKDLARANAREVCRIASRSR
jgi:N-acetylglucosaminyldiphosphoundecaprenol N-acetyl-beta-D-mannosaminyltransferase